jgi:hypothetical protein
METKAFINFNKGTVELVGSEDFILKYLSRFGESLIEKQPVQTSIPEINIEVDKKLVPKKEFVEKKKAEPELEKEIIIPESVEEKVETAIEVILPPDETTKTTKIKGKPGRKKSSPKISGSIVKKDKPAKKTEKDDGSFDFFADESNPSLVDFLKTKNPNQAAAHMVTAIAYYVTILKKKETFSVKNIEFAYDILSIPNKPKAIYQVIVYGINKTRYFVPGERGFWKLTKLGRSFVETELPIK